MKVDSLLKNDRKFSLGSNLSKLFIRMILNGLGNAYEQNTSEAQFRLRKSCSVCDEIFLSKILLKLVWWHKHESI